MDEFIKKIEKTQEKSEELLVERIKKELLEGKLKNLEKKEKKEEYNFDFTNLDIDFIGLEEAKLWDMSNNIKTKEEWDKAVKDFYVYRKKTVEEIQKEKERGEIKGAILRGDMVIHPRGEFLSLLGNKLTGLNLNKKVK